MKIEHARLAGRLSEIAHDFHRRGWCLGTGGNFSATLSRDPLHLLISRSGRDKQSLSERDFLVVGPEGKPAGENGDRPSAEALLHCVVAGATDAAAVLHTHSVAGTLLGEHFGPRRGFTVGGYEMLKGLAGIDSHRAELYVPVLENSQDMRELGHRVASLLSERPGLHGFLIAGHGMYAWGGSLEEARRHVEILEFLLECLARRTRFEPFAG